MECQRAKITLLTDIAAKKNLGMSLVLGQSAC
jgi:hypothetical protein